MAFHPTYPCAHYHQTPVRLLDLNYSTAIRAPHATVLVETVHERCDQLYAVSVEIDPSFWRDMDLDLIREVFVESDRATRGAGSRSRWCVATMNDHQTASTECRHLAAAAAAGSQATAVHRQLGLTSSLTMTTTTTLWLC